MARPREFDIDAALNGALEVFWEKGYGDASLPDLLEGMKLTRGSLYKAFTDKKTLYLRVLARYDEKEVGEGVRFLCDPDVAGLVRIETTFQAISEEVAAGDRRGCLLCSAAAGPAAFDADIRACVAASLGRMQVGFQTALEAALESSPTLGDAAANAQFLINQYVGHHIMARAGAPAEALRQSCAALMRLLTTR